MEDYIIKDHDIIHDIISVVHCFIWDSYDQAIDNYRADEWLVSQEKLLLHLDDSYELYDMYSAQEITIGEYAKFSKRECDFIEANGIGFHIEDRENILSRFKRLMKAVKSFDMADLGVVRSVISKSLHAHEDEILDKNLLEKFRHIPQHLTKEELACAMKDAYDLIAVKDYFTQVDREESDILYGYKVYMDFNFIKNEKRGIYQKI